MAPRAGPAPAWISTVLTTRDRAKQLAETLRRFDVLTSDPDWDLVVVDDHSGDDTLPVLERAKRRLGERLTVCVAAGRGQGAARNVGWRAARGAIIHFTDDDCYPVPDLLDQVRAVLADPEVGFAGGRMLPFDPSDSTVAMVVRTEPVRLEPGQFLPAGMIAGGNMAVRREALERACGFDPAMGAGARFAADDVDLAARLLTLGYFGRYDPRLVVLHHHRRQTETAVRAIQRRYDHGRGAYYAKCLLVPPLRGRYLTTWARLSWRGSWPRAGRELMGALDYWWFRFKRTSRKAP